MSVTAKEQIDIDSCHVVPDKFIYDQVQELTALKDEKQARLVPKFVERALVVNEAPYHESGHHDDLQTDPYLLDDVSESVSVLSIFFLSEPNFLHDFLDIWHLSINSSLVLKIYL